MLSKPNIDIYILGCERSGSTWLSNIIESHHSTEFYMEPFAMGNDFFPGFPDRNIYIKNKSNYLINIINKGLIGVKGSKYLIFYKHGRPSCLRWLDTCVVSILRLMAKFLRFRLPLRAHRYLSINSNSLQNPNVVLNRNWSINPTFVIKELRLNFKISLVREVSPDAKVLVAIRDPISQIRSIKNLFKRGRLIELNLSLMTFFDQIEANVFFKKYDQLIQEAEGDDDKLLLIWWLVNYETLIDDCKTFGIPYYIVYHEDICANSTEEVNRIFNFIGIDSSPDVSKYIKLSGSTSDNDNPLNTQRCSDNTAISSVDDEGLLAGMTWIRQRWKVIDELERYFL